MKRITGEHPSVAAPPAGSFLPESFESESDRLDWFLLQRTYPDHLGHLSPLARSNALTIVRQLELESSSKALAARKPLWRGIGPLPISSYIESMRPTTGRISAIAVSPSNSKLVLVGGATGGIWRSVDGGETFSPVSDDQIDLAVGDIEFAAGDPAIVYAGMGDAVGGYLGEGLLKSSDGGRHWKKITGAGLPVGTTAKIVVDPAKPDRIYLAQYRFLDPKGSGALLVGGFRISTDGGASWSETKKTGLTKDLIMHPAKPGILYLAEINAPTGPVAAVFKSTDHGMSWQPVFVPSYDETRDLKIAVTPSEPDSLYVFSSGFTNKQLRSSLDLSKDLGSNWINLGAPAIDLLGSGYLAVDPANSNAIYIGTRDLFKSCDGAKTWNNLTKNWILVNGVFEFHPENATSHTDQHVFAFSTSEPGVIYIGNDGGLWLSMDGGESFKSLNHSLALAQLNSITSHPTDASITYGGTQDNGVLIRREKRDEQVWTEFYPGDSGGCVFSPYDSDVVIASYVYGVLDRFKNKCEFECTITTSETFLERSDPPRIGFYPAFTSEPLKRKLYFGTWKLFASSDQGDTWAEVGCGQDLTKGANSKQRPDVLSVIAVSPSDGDVLYTGSSHGRVMVTRDGGNTWTDVTSGLPDRFIKSIVVDPNDSSTAYLTVSGFGTGHVFKTTDAGASWSDISGDLVDIPVNALILDQSDKNILYIGTDVGVFRSTIGGHHWIPFNRGGLPPVIVMGFARSADGKIQIATFGRGAYELSR